MTRTLIDYIKEDNLKAIEDLIHSLPVCINNIDEYSNTVLHHAVKMGNLKVVNLLLKTAKYLINTPNELGNVPLMIAAGEGDVKIVDILLQHGARADLENFDGFTSAHFAAYVNNLDIMKSLESYGCNILSPDILSAAVLQAIDDQSWKLTKWLIAHKEVDLFRENNGLSIYNLMRSDEIGAGIIEDMLINQPFISLEALDN